VIQGILMPYTKIDRRIQNDARFRILSDDGKLVFFLLLTHPNMTSLGVLRSCPEALSVESGWDLERYRKAFRESVREGVLEYFPEDLWITFPNWLKYNAANNPNVLKSWVGAWDTLPECRHKVTLWNRLKGFAEGVSEAFGKAFAKAFGSSAPNTVAVAVAVTVAVAENVYDNDKRQTTLDQTPPPASPDPRPPPPAPPPSPPASGGRNPLYTPSFETFWGAYPRKVGKGKAARAWKTRKAHEHLEAILLHIQADIASEQWRDPNLIPHPTTWLNQERWDDPLTPAGVGRSSHGEGPQMVEDAARNAARIRKATGF